MLYRVETAFNTDLSASKQNRVFLILIPLLNHPDHETHVRLPGHKQICHRMRGEKEEQK